MKNPELAEVLKNSPSRGVGDKILEQDIPVVSEQIKYDTYIHQGSGRHKNHTTVAAMLSYSSTLRGLMSRAELAEFDRIVEIARQKWRDTETKQAVGGILLCHLQENSPPPF